MHCILGQLTTKSISFSPLFFDQQWLPFSLGYPAEIVCMCSEGSDPVKVSQINVIVFILC